VLPFVLGESTSIPQEITHHHVISSAAGATDASSASLAAVDAVTIVAPAVHTLGYLVVTIALALVVYERLGVRVLRRAWINFDVIWGVAMVAAAVFCLIP